MSGPYEIEREALDDCAPIYAAMRAQTSPMQALNLAVLEDACHVASADLGAYDRKILAWLAGFEPQTTQVIAEIIRRAGSNG